MQRLAAATLIFAAFASSSAFAAEHSINHRQHQQDQRIAQGIQSGELTQAEAKSLRTERKAIHTEERAYRADGKFTKVERKDVQQDLNQMSGDIHREKHDAERR